MKRGVGFMDKNKPGDGFARAKARPGITVRRVLFAIFILAGLAFVVIQLASDSGVVPTVEYNTITVSSDRIEFLQSGIRNAQRIYSVRYLPYLYLEANSSQYQELREQFRSEGLLRSRYLQHIRFEPQFVDGEWVVARSEGTNIMMVELRYIPDVGRHISDIAATAENRGRLLDFTLLYEDNTITVYSGSIEALEIPMVIGGGSGWTSWLILEDGQHLSTSVQHRGQLRRLTQDENVMLELHYRVHSRRLLDFAVLEN